MKRSISKICLAVVALAVAASALAGQVSDMDGTAEELLNSQDGGKNLIAFGRCAAVLFHLGAMSKAQGTNMPIFNDSADTYSQALIRTAGATTQAQKEPLKRAVLDIASEYRKLQDTQEGKQRIKDDSHACLSFIGSGNK